MTPRRIIAVHLRFPDDGAGAGDREMIAAYAKGRAVTVEDINAVADPVLDARVFDMTNSITAGKYDQAAQVLGELLRMQTEPIVILAAGGPRN